MSGIQKLAKLDVSEFDNVWERWRSASYNITECSTELVRELYAQFGLLLSYSQLNESLVESNHASAKVQLGLVKSYLLSRVYNKDTVQRNNADVEADDSYIKAINTLDDLNRELIIAKGEVLSCETAWQTLSRELSARLK